MIDTLGYIGQIVAEKAPEYWPYIAPVLAAIGGALYRLAQKKLQSMPTRWKWVNNRLTVSIIGKIVCLVFGKTTLLYNAIPPDNDRRSVDELKRIAIKHLDRQGGIMQEFEKAVGK